MLTCEDAILVAIEIVGSLGRTALQKVVYFGKESELVAAGYEPHYYGPYSHEVSATLQSLVALGWVDESIEAWPASNVWSERRRYTYHLTSAGADARKKLVKRDSTTAAFEKIVTVCREKTNLDFRMLSWAAKTRVILTEGVKKGQALTVTEICDRGKNFGWQLTKDQIIAVADLLETLGLAHRARKKPA